MRAAIYARVSTDEQGASIGAQEADARRFAESRGWSVAAVYRDEGVSGADFVTRPSLLRMLADVIRSPRPWDVLVMRDVDRLGREQAQTIIAVERIISKGARIFVYNGAREVSLTPMEKAMLGMQAVFGEFERAMIVDRVRGALEYRARKGLATGGVAYGYRNVRRPDGFADFEVDPREAAVVREVFEWRAEGAGLREIVGRLNARGTPSPWAGKRGTRSWCPSEVLHMLRAERYRGVLSWGRLRKSYSEGRKVRTVQGDEAVVRFERPDLRIVPEDLWERARNVQAPPAAAVKRGKAPRYLLTGFARCGRCDGPMVVSSKKHGNVNVRAYLCSRARDRGPTVCTAKLRRPVEEVDAAVVRWFKANVLDEGFVDEALEEVYRQLEERAAAPDPSAAIASRLRVVEAEAGRLAEAIARCDGPPESLVRAIQEREATAKALRAKLALAAKVGPTLAAWDDVERRFRARVADLAGAFERNLEGGRRVLAALLATPLRVTCVMVGDRRRFHLSGRARIPLTIEAIADESAGNTGGADTVNLSVSPEGVGRIDSTPNPLLRPVAINILADGSGDAACA